MTNGTDVTTFKHSSTDKVGFGVLLCWQSGVTPNCVRKLITYRPNNRVGNRKCSGHLTGGSNYTSVLSSLSLLCCQSPIQSSISSMQSGKPNRFNEVRKPTRSSRVLELEVVIV